MRSCVELWRTLYPSAVKTDPCVLMTAAVPAWLGLVLQCCSSGCTADRTVGSLFFPKETHPMRILQLKVNKTLVSHVRAWVFCVGFFFFFVGCIYLQLQQLAVNDRQSAFLQLFLWPCPSRRVSSIFCGSGLTVAAVPFRLLSWLNFGVLFWQIITMLNTT